MDETRRICDEDDDLAEVTPGIKTTPFLKTRINACFQNITASNQFILSELTEKFSPEKSLITSHNQFELKKIILVLK